MNRASLFASSGHFFVNFAPQLTLRVHLRIVVFRLPSFRPPAATTQNRPFDASPGRPHPRAQLSMRMLHQAVVNSADCTPFWLITCARWFAPRLMVMNDDAGRVLRGLQDGGGRRQKTSANRQLPSNRHLHPYLQPHRTTNIVLLVPLRSCQAFPQAEHPEQDARWRQGRRLRYRCPGVPHCRSSRAGRCKFSPCCVVGVAWRRHGHQQRSVVGSVLIPCRTPPRISRSSVSLPAISSSPSVVTKSWTL